MFPTRPLRRTAAGATPHMYSSAGVAVVALSAGLALTGCSTGGGDDGTLNILIDNSEATGQLMQALVDAYTEANPDVEIELELRPGGSEGDNIVKTRLQTGDMPDLFFYNSGSLLQALAPDQTLVDLAGESYMDVVTDTFKDGVSAGDALYGVPVGHAVGGGVLYDLAAYEELGLEVPTTWDEFMANNQAILDAGGRAPVIQTYGTESAWTSQLFVLADNYNVLAAEPDWAEAYTANEKHFADTPAAAAGFEHLQEVAEAGYLNEDFASLTYNEGLAALAAGEGVHYPMLTTALTEIEATDPDALDGIGFFALPGTDAANAGLTTWLPGALYLPQSTEDQGAAKDFLAFVASTEGCDAQTAGASVIGPYFIEGCTVPEDVPPAVAQLQSYFDSGLTAPALEFLSPVKGPALEQITVEVGSGIRTAADAASLYDEDVKKQAQQLGLEGW
ncbi:carbohydrate ABC transporter substrate-binding protein (CUT1 family) [Glycomyces artemisiae]|uniref:Carbohydrate ABC transporter substrate-binding protein (CUT1 family) n=2 Tax=Glycomyces artemisiae TaxID=1076443 RepID=A0A2T0UX46_9ACTN|nr:carbohydrate ABC transporter substrate-binding protein (CUT1 family) [Glycomyces artemisiae]